MRNLRNNGDTRSTKPGTLYIVATPIGNLDDLGHRARRILSQVDMVLAEDTRHSRKLLDYYGISRRLVSLHEHNEQKKVPRIVGQLRNGGSVALISDAGTPLISDPGHLLVTAARQAGIAVIAVPGPSAVSAALSVSGLPIRRFGFEGFAPPTGTARQTFMRSVACDRRTLVFFEAPHRLKSFLRDAAAIFGNSRPACLIKEISKIHETSVSGDLATLHDWLETDPGHARGEFVIVISGIDHVPRADTAEVLRILRLLLEKLPTGEAVGLTARISHWNRNAVYRLHNSLPVSTTDRHRRGKQPDAGRTKRSKT